MTGLIYVAIIALWAAVLVPMWMRRHDHRNESRHADRFNHAMRSLAHPGRRSRPGEREVLQPRRDRQREVVVTGARGRVDRPLSASERRAARGLDREDVRHGSRAARRRRVLVALLAVVVLVLAAVAAGLLPTLALALPLVLLVGFVLTGGRSSTASTAATARRPRSSGPARRPYDDVDARPRAGRRSFAPPPVPPAHLAATGTDDRDPRAWEPVPTTLPTYVNAPRASGIPRILDLTTPGSWTSAAMLEHAQQLRDPHRDADRDQPFDQHAEQAAALAEDVDAAVADYADPYRRTQRRAVNG